METSNRINLNNRDFLVGLLSSLGAGRQRDLRANLKKVLYSEEYPEKGSVHPLIQGRYFVDRTRLFTRSFEEAWLNLIQHAFLDHVGFEGDYIVNYGATEYMREMIKEGKISEEDKNYFESFREKISRMTW